MFIFTIALILITYLVFKSIQKCQTSRDHSHCDWHNVKEFRDAINKKKK